MARKKKDGYMPKSEVLLILQNYIRTIQMNDYGTDSGIPQLYKAMTYIEDAPTADVVEVRHGKWKEMAEYEHGGIKKIFFECPLCGRIEYQKEPYCHCGARMGGDEDDL